MSKFLPPWLISLIETVGLTLAKLFIKLPPEVWAAIEAFFKALKGIPVSQREQAARDFRKMTDDCIGGMCRDNLKRE